MQQYGMGSKTIVIGVGLLAVFILFIGFNMFMSNSRPSVQSSNTLVRLESIPPTDFADEVSQNNAIVLDIRTPQEFNSGHISGAINIDYYDSNFQDNIEKLSRSTPYKIYCNSGNRSASALSLMKQMGFEDVSELQGGIQAWMKSGNDVCRNC